MNVLHFKLASSDKLLNLLLTDPNLLVGLDVRQCEIRLIKDDLFAFHTVFDGVDFTSHHVIGTEFLSHPFNGFE